MTTLLTRDGLPGLVGTSLGPGEWVTVTQERINEFARASGDHQWIHVDAKRAAQGPFCKTIAHGLLTLSMIATLSHGLFQFDGFKMGVNYGYDKIRFPTPVPVDSRLRAAAVILNFEATGMSFQTIVEFTVEREGADKPACIAQMIFRHFV
jgi:acyl dehydratase